MLGAVRVSSSRAPARCPVGFTAPVSLVVAALVAGTATLWHPLAAVRAADVTISSAVGGPQFGQGGTFTVTTTGTITSDGAGIVATGTTAITTLTIDGAVGPVHSNAIQNDAGSSITSIGVSGTVTGGSEGRGLLNSGIVGSLTTSVGGRLESGGGSGIQNDGTFTGTISNAGTLAGYVAGLDNQSTGQIFAFTNSGLVTGDAGVRTFGSITTLTNEVGGYLQGSGWGLLVDTGGSVGTLLNSGSVTGYNALFANGGITTLTNSGTLAGSHQGIGLGGTASVGSFTNSGLVSGGGPWGMGADAGATIGTLTNSGTFTGYNGYVSAAVTGTIRNLAGGLFEGTGNRGLGQDGTLTLLENAGSITSTDNGIETKGDIGTIDNQAGGLISGVNRGLWLNSESNTVTTITNSGTIEGGNAIESQGAIGTLTNSAGGVVVGGNVGVYLGGAVTRVENAGSITSTNNGIETKGDVGTIDNLAGGLISGVNRGLWLNSESNTVTTITNSGTIEGGNAIESQGAIGTLTNSAGGVVVGGNVGVYLGGAVTRVENAGSITSTNNGIETRGDIGTIDNQAGGLIEGGNAGVWVANGLLQTLTNSGTISGFHGIEKSATIGTLTNTATGLIEGTNSGLYSSWYGDLTVVNSGRITGGSYGVNGYYDVTQLTNMSGGVISGTDGAGIILNDNAGTITNEAGGRIESANGYGISVGGYGPAYVTGTIANAGLIEGGITGVRVANGLLETLTNSGTISGFYGIDKSATISTLTNTATGLIEGTDSGLYSSWYGDLTVVNSGRITGGSYGVNGFFDVTQLTNMSGGVISGTDGAGIILNDNAGTITNEAGGRIESANGYGISVGGYGPAYVTGTIANAGLIEGGITGVWVANGLLQKLTNTGTVAFTGGGTGPAVFVGPGGVLGDATGAGGAALVSTGAGALLDGIIVNQGTIDHGFTIENQSVTVSADGGVGTFTSGLLDVVDGDLTFTGGGTTTLDANVRVNGGSGTVFNEAVLAVIGSGSIAGNFTQTPAGTTSSIISDPSTFGSLSISGAATFAGVFDLGLVGGFALADGQLFKVFSYGSYTGDFSGLSVNGVALTSYGANQWLYGGLVLEEQWDESGFGVSVAAVPEPSTFALGAAGIACAAWLRHRRRAAARSGGRLSPAAARVT